MDVLNQLRRIGNEVEGTSSAKSAMAGTFRPQTISEIIDGQIQYHESKVADLKAAKEAISPDVEKALNALAKL